MRDTEDAPEAVSPTSTRQEQRKQSKKTAASPTQSTLKHDRAP